MMRFWERFQKASKDIPRVSNCNPIQGVQNVSKVLRLTRKVPRGKTQIGSVSGRRVRRRDFSFPVIKEMIGDARTTHLGVADRASQRLCRSEVLVRGYFQSSPLPTFAAACEPMHFLKTEKVEFSPACESDLNLKMADS